MTAPALIDTAVNLTDKRFNDDREQVIERARRGGIRAQIVTGTSLEASMKARELAAQYPDLFATAGVHPHVARDFTSETASQLKELLTSPEADMRAVGETGLDFNRDFSPRGDQERAFVAQLELAVETGMPVFLHQRDAHERFLPILRDFRERLSAAVVHCFTGTREELFDYLDLDCHIGITGWLCDERRGGTLRELVPNIPRERLMIETDSPWLIPRNLAEPPPVRGRNEPALLPEVLRQLAHCRNVPAEELAAATFDNSCRFFSLDPAALPGHPED